MLMLREQGKTHVGPRSVTYWGTEVRIQFITLSANKTLLSPWFCV